MNYELLFKMEQEENKILKKELFLVKTRLIEEKSIKQMYIDKVKQLEKEKETLFQMIEELERQNDTSKEKLVERIIIETYA